MPATLGPVIRNIIFDWSGTLVDDLPAVWEATNYVLTQAERPEMSLEQFRAEFCLPFTIFYDKPHAAHPAAPTGDLVSRPVPRRCRVRSARCRTRASSWSSAARAQLRTFLLSTVHRDHFRRPVGRHGVWAVPRQAVRQVWDKREKIREILDENRPGARRDDVHRRHAARHRDRPARRHSFVRRAHGLQHAGATARPEPDLIVEHLRELRDILQPE